MTDYSNASALNVVLDQTRLSRSSLYQKIKGRTFPKSVQPGERSVSWHSSAIDAWVRNPIFCRPKIVLIFDSYTLETSRADAMVNRAGPAVVQV